VEWGGCCRILCRPSAPAYLRTLGPSLGIIPTIQIIPIVPLIIRLASQASDPRRCSHVKHVSNSKHGWRGLAPAPGSVQDAAWTRIATFKQERFPGLVGWRSPPRQIGSSGPHRLWDGALSLESVGARASPRARSFPGRRGRRATWIRDSQRTAPASRVSGGRCRRRTKLTTREGIEAGSATGVRKRTSSLAVSESPDSRPGVPIW